MRRRRWLCRGSVSHGPRKPDLRDLAYPAGQGTRNLYTPDRSRNKDGLWRRSLQNQSRMSAQIEDLQVYPKLTHAFAVIIKVCEAAQSTDRAWSRFDPRRTATVCVHEAWLASGRI